MSDTLTTEKGLDVFALHGLSFLSLEDLSVHYAPVCKDFRATYKSELQRRCKARHPDLLAIDPEGITWNRWKRFHLSEGDSRQSGAAWENLTKLEDAISDVDVMLEITQGDVLLAHSTAPLKKSEKFMAESTLSFPHWTFDAPRPGPNDQFAVSDPIFPGLKIFHFWCGRFECTHQQKGLIKAIYGSDSSHLEASLPPLWVHVVFRRRSTGQMATVLSKRIPNEVKGEDYNLPVGMFEIDYDTSPGQNDDEAILACLDFSIFCPSKLRYDQTHISYSTNPSVNQYSSIASPKKASDAACAHFKFQGCDLDLEEEEVIRAFQSWRWD